MRLTRVHLEQPLSDGIEVSLPENAATHLTRVLRLAVGDPCIVFNGDGFDYAATLLSAGNDPKVAELFAHAELRRAGCMAGKTPTADWVNGLQEPSLRGRI